jgi:glucose/arabinose dehydrogenase
MVLRLARILAGVVVATGLLAGPAAARPIARNHTRVQLVARDVATPTAFAFSRRGSVFMSDGTSPREAPGIGGVYVLAKGRAARMAGSPPFSYGLAWHRGTLYISAGTELLAWSGWTGGKFTHRRTLYTAPAGFTGFNGLAFGANNRLYVGVNLGDGNDHGPATAPYQYDILSLTPRGTDVRVVAQGIRQPWQFAFPIGSSSPFVSDLGQDLGAKNPPDLLLRVRPGQDYGFPKCNRTERRRCRGYAKPARRFIAHSDPMGLAIVGQRLYISEFGAATPARVISIPLTGGKGRVELSGFARHSNIVGLGAQNGWIYVGQTASSKTHLGAVWRFRP